MLEVKNLTKVYKTKGGAETRALDGVSLRFEERGMIFLLGKSGSGKSTLLNLCGGLDTPDSGEIIIKGRSSKDFSQADFDSYRNTFVGFVFQEYNILNEFTVEDNIALALELQGKNKDKARVHEILEQVEMSEFAKRKPNTLSGGQKQRIAIARALVKNPEIIMADEPTGALDSNTGKQVFDTLKKLSQDKLVLVVSHDREFAEIYGDRIVELKDGKVISDVTKTKLAALPASDNLTFIGEDTLSIKSGAALTAADMERVRQFLARTPGSVLLSGGAREIADFKKAARIDESGAREAFRETDEAALAAKSYTPEDSRFIRSKLPAKHAFRIGLSGMKAKPFRLFFTIFLSFIAFTMFGLFSTLTFYDSHSSMYQTYLTSGYSALKIDRYYNYRYNTYKDDKLDSSWQTSRQDLFGKADLAEFRQEYGEDVFGLINFDEDFYNSFRISNTGVSSSAYYSNTLSGFAEISAQSTYFEMLAGGIGELGEDGIAISSYTFDTLRAIGLKDAESGAEIELNDYADILGKTVVVADFFNETELTVEGVFRQEPPDKYAALKEGGGASQELSEQFREDMQRSLYAVALVSEDFFDAHRQDFNFDTEQNNSEIPFRDYFTYLNSNYQASDSRNDPFNGERQEFTLAGYTVNSAASAEEEIFRDYLYLTDGRTSLSDGEVVVPFTAVELILTEACWKVKEGLYADEKSEEGDQFERDFEKYRQILSYGYYTVNDDETGSSADYTASEEDYRQAVDFMLALMDDSLGYLGGALDWGQLSLYTDSNIAYQSYTVAGFYYGPLHSQNWNGVLLSPSDFRALLTASGNNPDAPVYRTEESTNYVRPEDARYCSFLLPFPEDGVLRAIVYGNGEADSQTDALYLLDSPIADTFRTIDSMIETFEQVFLWVGVAMAVFSMLLLFNFISVSISYKKKEIGILRAVGARSADVFKIFYSESAIIALICFVLAMVASFITCGVLNSMLAAELGASIFVFGPVSWLIMLGIAVVTSVIATFLPVYGIAKRKPVESIRAL